MKQDILKFTTILNQAQHNNIKKILMQDFHGNGMPQKQFIQ